MISNKDFQSAQKGSTLACRKYGVPHSFENEMQEFALNELDCENMSIKKIAWHCAKYANDTHKLGIGHKLYDRTLHKN